MATAMSAAEEQSIREIVNAYRTDGTTVVEAFEQYRRKQFRRIHSEISREHQAFLNLAETKLRADLNIVKECSTAGKFRSYKLAVEGEFTSLEEWCEQLSA